MIDPVQNLLVHQSAFSKGTGRQPSEKLINAILALKKPNDTKILVEDATFANINFMPYE